MKTLNAKQRRLAAVPLFAHCGARQLARIDSLADEVEYPAGKHLITQGRVGREFFILESGAAVVRRDGEEVATLGPGDTTGELALLTRSPLRTADVVTTEPSTVIVLGAREFRDLLIDDPRIALRLLSTLAGWLTRVTEPVIIEM